MGGSAFLQDPRFLFNTTNPVQIKQDLRTPFVTSGPSGGEGIDCHTSGTINWWPGNFFYLIPAPSGKLFRNCFPLESRQFLWENSLLLISQ